MMVEGVLEMAGEGNGWRTTQWFRPITFRSNPRRGLMGGWMGGGEGVGMANLSSKTGKLSSEEERLS